MRMNPFPLALSTTLLATSASAASPLSTTLSSEATQVLQGPGLHVSCSLSTRAALEHLVLTANPEGQALVFVATSSSVFQDASEASPGLAYLAPGAGRYPTVAQVSVTEKDDGTVEINARSEVVGGRNPHVQVVHGQFVPTGIPAGSYVLAGLTYNGNDVFSDAHAPLSCNVAWRNSSATSVEHD